MWDQEDSLTWFWLNTITTLYIVVLAIEQYTDLVASPFGVLGYAVVGWAILRFLEWFSKSDNDDGLDEIAFGISFIFGICIQIILVSGLVWNQWVLTNNIIWLYAPVLPVVYWLAQITYGIAKTYRCVVEE
jgi:hypothetical protein